MRTIIFSILLVVVSLPAFAQNHRIQNDIYNRYSSENGVSAVYISPAMFKMMKQLPEMDGVDISPAVSSLEGMYVLEIEGNPELSGKMYKDIDSYVNSGKYELLMEAKDDGDNMRMYVSYDKDGNISEFLMLAMEPDSLAYISFVGKIDYESFVNLIGENM